MGRERAKLVLSSVPEEKGIADEVRQQILSDLNNGELTAEEAMELLRD